jgi:hypothetical protein
MPEVPVPVGTPNLLFVSVVADDVAIFYSICSL